MIRALRLLVLAETGGLIYLLIEMMFRGHTHWTMLFVGGICFVLVGLINEIFPWDMSFALQCIIGGAIITAVEFLSGCVINLWFGLGVWDYSNLPFNILGQVCLPFTFLWVLISIPAILLDDYLRYFMGEEKPRYKFM